MMDSTSIILSVIVPTRNRPDSIQALLGNLRLQTLRPNDFEIIVVDDGSEPPINITCNNGCSPLEIRVIRRNTDHGAHPSRLTGLHAARGNRVLFLDDDITVDPNALEEHASPSLGERVALGPIRYPHSDTASPFYRYMSHYYEACYERQRANNWVLDVGDYYVCNSSASRRLFIELFKAASFIYPHKMTGGGFDESLLELAYAERGVPAILLPLAMIWHSDRKSLSQARHEGHQAGRAQAQLLASHDPKMLHRRMAEPILSTSFVSFVRRLAMHCFWLSPGPFLVVANILTHLAEHGPIRFTPRWVCHFPERVSRWEGMRSVIPDFKRFIFSLRAHQRSLADG